METKNMIIGTTEAAKYVGVSTTSIQNWINSGRVNPITPFRGRPIYDKSELDKIKSDRE